MAQAFPQGRRCCSQHWSRSVFRAQRSQRTWAGSLVGRWRGCGGAHEAAKALIRRWLHNLEQVAPYTLPHTVPQAGCLGRELGNAAALTRSAADWHLNNTGCTRGPAP